MGDSLVTSEKEQCSKNRLLPCVGYLDAFIVLVRSNVDDRVNHLGAYDTKVGGCWEHWLMVWLVNFKTRWCSAMITFVEGLFSTSLSVAKNESFDFSMYSKAIPLSSRVLVCITLRWFHCRIQVSADEDATHLLALSMLRALLSLAVLVVEVLNDEMNRLMRFTRT